MRRPLLAIVWLSTVTIGWTGEPRPWAAEAVATRYSGTEAAQAALLDRSSRATAMATADFDEDGVPDLLCAYAGAAGGTLVLHRGNVDAIYPNAPEARERKAQGRFTSAAFLPEAVVVLLPAEPGFLGAGDFDADGHWDAVVAAATEAALYLLPGTGKGGFGPPRRLPLSGAVTALQTGEVNRRDGLTDIVVGVAAAGGAQVLVYEAPEGALRRDPEIFPAPARVTSLVLEGLSGTYSNDVAAAAGKQVMVLHGRDRKLSLDEKQRATVLPAVVDRIRLPFQVAAIATGNLDGTGDRSLAVLSQDGALYHGSARRLMDAARDGSDPMRVLGPPRLQGSGARLLVRARVSARPGDDLLLLDRGHRRIDRLTAGATRHESGLQLSDEPVAALPMRLNADAVNDIVILLDRLGSPLVAPSTPVSTFTVTSTTDPGDGVCDADCTLREAIDAANASLGSDAIEFDIPGKGPHTIQVLDYLPLVSESVLMDATTEPGYPGTPWVMLDGSLIPGFPGLGEVEGLGFTGGSSTIRGLAVSGFNNGGFLVGSVCGISLRRDADDIIEGNFIGTDFSGSIAVSSCDGVCMSGERHAIGGTVPAARNVISGNGRNIVMGDVSSDCHIQGNLVGLDAAGTRALGSTFGAGGSAGIDVWALGPGFVIGGTIPGSRNVITGTGTATGATSALSLRGPGTVVQGNYIGTDITGALSTGSADLGVSIDGAASDNLIGGTSPAARNVISGNGMAGVWLREAMPDLVTANLVQGNYIGIDAGGTAALANGLDSRDEYWSNGVWIHRASGNAIGGTAAGAGNVISGNAGAGLLETRTNGNLIAGNYIGTDRTGAAPLPNLSGVLFADGTIDSVLGGTAVAAHNVISANTTFGVGLHDPNTARIQILGNRIGTDISGSLALGNGGHGIEVIESTSNIIGGSAILEGNLIRHNALAGVSIDEQLATGNAIRFNSISDNAGLGIDLAPTGVTPNDPDDSDLGPNNLQNFPILTISSTSGTDIDVAGALHSKPGFDYTIDVYASPACDPAGQGEGQAYVGSIAVTTNSAGRAAFVRRFVTTVPIGQAITATAVDENGNTSEFSPCLVAGFRPPGAGAPTGLHFTDGGGTRLDWDPTDGADRYGLYRGTQLDLSRLITSEIDSCTRAIVTQPSSGSLLTETPKVGEMIWYLVTGMNESGDGSAGTALLGNANQGPVERQLNSAGICPSSDCPHDRCDIGPALSPVCGSCIDAICAADPLCCGGPNGFWGADCVKKVRNVCLEISCPDSQGTCSHPVCKVGTALVPGCDPPAGNVNSCVAAICNVDSFCCNGQTGFWDDVCTSEVATVCGLTCSPSPTW